MGVVEWDGMDRCGVFANLFLGLFGDYQGKSNQRKSYDINYVQFDIYIYIDNYIYTHICIYIYRVSPGLTLLAGYFINPCHLRPAWLRGLSIALGVLVSLSRQLLLPPLGTGFDALFRSLGRVAGSPKMARLWTQKMAPNCLS